MVLLRARAAREHLSPLSRHMLRRVLGEVLGGEEGAALVAEGDEFLRQCGVVKAVNSMRSPATLRTNFQGPLPTGFLRNSSSPTFSI